MNDPYRDIRVTRVGPDVRSVESDRAATEEPLEIRLHRHPFAVVMRTPGDDIDLTAGFLLSELVIRNLQDVGTIGHCSRTSSHPDEDNAGNVVNVALCGDARAQLERRLADRRNVTTNSSCGMCGRLTIDALRVEAPTITASWTIGAGTASALPRLLRRGQTVFDRTGGLHAAGLFQRDGKCVALAEDVGRHNAVDKVIGRMLLEGRLPLADSILAVSGRTSYEIVQKAFLAGIPLVAAVSAPSSLAIDLAEDAGITLLGFVRDGGFNVYAHAERIAPTVS